MKDRFSAKLTVKLAVAVNKEEVFDIGKIEKLWWSIHFQQTS